MQRPVVLKKAPPPQERRVKFCEQLEVRLATYSPHEYDRRRFHTPPGEHMVCSLPVKKKRKSERTKSMLHMVKI